jgi:NDP-sugar pyrophosphorylase family protein
MSRELYGRIVPSLARALPEFALEEPPWILVASLPSAIAALAASGRLRAFEARGGDVFVHPEAEVEPGATFRGPALIGAGCFVARSAYLRDGVVLGPRTHVGHAVELKASVVAGDSAIAHLGYVGNSVIGSGVNLEAGVVVANHWNESPGRTIALRWRGATLETGAAKFGALIGDGAKVGANSVLSPGTVLEPGAIVPRLTLIS